MKYVIDIDGTICKEVGEVIGREPYLDRIAKINKLYDEGNYIIIDSARGSGTGKYWTKTTAEQLNQWGVKYHKVRCGHKFAADFYIDDKALSDTDFFNK